MEGIILLAYVTDVGTIHDEYYQLIIHWISLWFSDVALQYDIDRLRQSYHYANRYVDHLLLIGHPIIVNITNVMT
jgi:hypothetical protein